MNYKRVKIEEFGGPEVLKIIQERDLPEPGDNEVRVKVLATSAAFTDTLVRKGTYPGVKNKLPFSPGYDMVGRVDKNGAGASKYKEGLMVASLTVTGSYTEYRCIKESALVPVPEGLDPAEAVSLVLSYGTAYQMLKHKAGVKEGDSVLIHGAGGAVGTALLQLGKVMKLKMYGTASRSKHEILEKEGAVPIDYKNEDFVERIHKETGGGVNAVFDAIGGDHFKRSFKTLKKGGTLIAYGFYDSGMGKGGSIPLDYLKIILWNILPNGRKSKFYFIRQNKRFNKDLAELLALLADEKVSPVIDRIMPLEKAAEAHRLIENAEVKGKIVLKIED